MDCGTGQTALISAKPLSLKDALQRFEREASRGIFDTGASRCPYYTWGQGPPLLFIHGLADFAAGYVPVISLLAEHFRCIAYDLPDGDQAGRLTHDDLVKDVFVLLDHLGLRQSYVLGSSFGSTLALAAMRACPERLPRGILAGGFAQRRLSPAEMLLARLGLHLPGRMGLLPFRRWVGRHNFGPLAKQRPELVEFFLQTGAATPLAPGARRALMIHSLDLCAYLPSIRQPVLMICGECDTLVRQQCEEPLLQGLPNVARVELADCGHVPHYSHPEAMAEVVRRFLTPPACPMH
jgi:pimeloyl-ACP methyl ester carboxylesterase